jgi:isoleucyl-tRNA synthetase
VFEGKPVEDYHKEFHPGTGWFAHGPSGGESHLEVKRRMGEALYDFEQKYQNKTILIVTHDTPAWLLSSVAQGLDQKETITFRDGAEFFMQNAEVIDLPFVPLSHNVDFELDLHRPYIDTVVLSCDCGGVLTRVKEVMDVWFDSGAMPFAQDHYPFEKKELAYPADFISEAIDQTRGWFYTLHAIGALMGKGKAYKNVICLGHILDKEGKKMSKSLGNIVEPWEEMDKFGVDALRFFMYSVNQPGDSKNYDAKTVDEIVKKVFNLLLNVLAFYRLYAGEVPHASVDPRKSPSVLDQWILAKTDEMVATTTFGFEHYQLFEPSRAIREFTADLSHWYLRRSRDRIKSGEPKDRAFALATTREVLLTVSKLLAPLTPFFAESLYQSLNGGRESVHLEVWPVSQLKTKDYQPSTIISEMEEVRKIVSLGLEARMKAKINVRQPLASFKFKSEKLQVKSAELFALIAEEVNVKKVVCDEKIVGDVALDTEITAELREEGMMREFIRAVQDLRKEKGLTVADRPTLVVSTDKAGQTFLTKFKTEILKANQLKELTFGEVLDAQNQVSFDTLTFSLEIK